MPAWNNATRAVPQRGVVHRAASADAFDLGRKAPAPELAPFVEHLWWVAWDRTGLEPFPSQTIPSPSCHLTVEGGFPGEVRHGHPMPATLVHGVATKRWVVELEGAGWVAGVHFRPGGWGAWSGGDAAAMTDRVERVTGSLADLHRIGPLDARLDALDAACAELAPAPGDDFLVVSAAVERMRTEPGLVRVEQLAETTGWTTRTLQRRFRGLVGVGAKWVLQRYRLLDAAIRLEEEPDTDLATLAVELGWYDQAHFTNHFRRMLGTTPADYVNQGRPAG